MRSLANLIASAAILAADPWPGMQVNRGAVCGGAPWAATRGKRRWKRVRRGR